MKTISQYCQKCRTPNELGELNCRECGTRLMIVVFPPSMRHDESIVPSYYEDHLLERVSLLELRLVQITEHIKTTYEFVRHEAEKFKKDREFLQVFFETIEKMNPQLAEEISKNFLEIRDEKQAKSAFESKRERLLKEIFEAHNSKQAELFTHLVNEGIRLLDANEEKQAFLNLERAALLSPENVPLFAYIAESYFRTDKFDKARKFLENACQLEPQNEKVLLLLGAVLADEGGSEDARKYLSVLANNPKFSVCVNFIWGMLAASETNWMESLAAFKEAANISETAEILYVIGASYFQLGQMENALNYANKAALYGHFSDAWFLQSLIYEQLGESDKAEDMRQMALDVKEAGAQCLDFLRGKKEFEAEIALPFLHFKTAKNKILTGGSQRLSRFFREQIYKAIE